MSKIIVYFAAALAVIAGTSAIAQNIDGLRMRTYNNYSGANLAEMTARTPFSDSLFQGAIWFDHGNVIGPVPHQTGWENFTVMWDGYVWLDAEQLYTFAVHSDDRSYIMIDTGRDGFDASDTVVAIGSNHEWVFYGTIQVAETGYYPIVIVFIQWGGGYYFRTRWDTGNKVGWDFWNGSIANTIDTSTLAANGFPMFSHTGSAPGMSWFVPPTTLAVDEMTGAVEVEATLGELGVNPVVSVAWGTQPGVFTATNSVSLGLAQDVPFAIPVPEFTPGTYACKVFVEDDGDFAQTAVCVPNVFYVGELELVKLSDADEATETPGVFEIRRTGESNFPLRVNYTLSGTADRDVDYAGAGLSGNVTILAGEAAAQIQITPLRNFGKLFDTVVAIALDTGSYATNVTFATASLTIFNEPLPLFEPWECVWISPVEGVASDPANWLGNRLPLATDTIIVGAYGRGNLIWDCDGENALPAQVAEWRQEAGYTGTVRFDTTYGADFPVFTITGDAVIEGGAWTHRANTSGTSEYYLNVKVQGDFTLAKNANINATDKGFTAWNGPAMLNMWNEFAASHGGQGDWISNNRNPNPNTYGSAVDPVDLGSGSRHVSGAGAIVLDVGGTALIRGNISANTYEVDGGGPSAGSVNLRAGEIDAASDGILMADSAYSHWIGGGGAGRVAVRVSQGEIPAGLQARARPVMHWDMSQPAAGTVYRSSPFENRILVSAEGAVDLQGTNKRTDFPARLVRADHSAIRADDADTDFGDTALELRHFGQLMIQHNVAVASLSMHTYTASVDLNGKTLRVRSFTSNNGVTTKTNGFYTDNASGDFNGVIFNGGKIVIGEMATLLIIR